MSFAPRPLLFPGIAFPFGGGINLVVPPLTVGALELLQDRLSTLPTLQATDPEALRTIVDAAHLALRRNYPDATRAEVADLVDVGNLGDVYECLMDVGGIKRRAQHEAAAGNPAAPAPGTAGAASTPG